MSEENSKKSTQQKRESRYSLRSSVILNEAGKSIFKIRRPNSNSESTPQKIKEKPATSKSDSEVEPQQNYVPYSSPKETTPVKQIISAVHEAIELAEELGNTPRPGTKTKLDEAAGGESPEHDLEDSDNGDIEDEYTEYLRRIKRRLSTGSNASDDLEKTLINSSGPTVSVTSDDLQNIKENENSIIKEGPPRQARDSTDTRSTITSFEPVPHSTASTRTNTVTQETARPARLHANAFVQGTSTSAGARRPENQFVPFSVPRTLFFAAATEEGLVHEESANITAVYSQPEENPIPIIRVDMDSTISESFNPATNQVQINKPKFVTPSAFKPGVDNPTQFIDQYEEVAKVNNWSGMHKTFFFENYLRGAAKTWFNKYRNTATNAQKKWTDIKAEFLYQFADDAYDNLQSNLLASRKQQLGESVKEFYYDIIDLCRKVDENMPFERVMDHFARGLLQKNRPYYALLADKTLNQEQFVRQVIRKLAGWEEQQNLTFQLGQVSFEKQGNGKEEKDKQEKERRQVQFRTRTGDGRPICFRCRKPGHIRASCDRQNNYRSFDNNRNGQWNRNNYRGPNSNDWNRNTYGRNNEWRGGNRNNEWGNRRNYDRNNGYGERWDNNNANSGRNNANNRENRENRREDRPSNRRGDNRTEEDNRSEQSYDNEDLN